jgi:hypothetical protein
VSFHRPNFERLFQFLAFVEITAIKMLPAVDGPVVSVLHQPHLSIAFAGVELCHRAINIQENGLGNVFGLTGIPNNFQSDAKDQLLVPVEENGERVALPLLEAGHQPLVGRTLQLR